MNFSIWTYRENSRRYPGYHLSGDDHACEQFIRWLEIDHRKRRPLPLVKPSSALLRVPNNRGGEAKISWFALIEFIQCSDHRFRIVPDISAQKITLECSDDYRRDLIDRVSKIPSGFGDENMGEEGQDVLWFWWFAA